jgi:HEAT repeat protein
VVSYEDIEKMEDEKDVDGLINALFDFNSDYRTETICALSNFNDENVLKALIKALNDDDQMVRREAIETLGIIGNPLAVEPLIKALDDENPFVICDVLDALAEIDDKKSIKSIERMLNSQDNDVKAHAVEALNKMGINIPKDIQDDVKSSTVNSLVPEKKILETDEHITAHIYLPGVKYEDIDVDINAYRLIVKANSDKLGVIQEKIKFPTSVISHKADGVYEEGVITVKVPKRFVNSSVKVNNASKNENLNKQLEDTDNQNDEILYYISIFASSNSNERTNAIRKLSLLGEPAFEEVLKASINDNSIIRQTICDYLRNERDPRCVEPLCDMLKDSDKNVRLKAAEALRAIGDQRAIPSLIEALDDSSTQVRGQAASALGNIGDERAIKPLKNRLDDNNGIVSFNAERALRKIGEKGIKAINDYKKDKIHIDALKEKEEKERFYEEWFKEIGNSKNIKDNKQPANDDNYEIKSDDQDENVIRDSSRGKSGVSMVSIEDIYDLGYEGNLDGLVELIQSLDSNRESENLEEFEKVRTQEKTGEAIIQEIEKIGGKNAMEALLIIINDENIDSNLQMAATGALGRIGDESVVEPLIEILKNNSMCTELAGFALGRIGDERAVEPLIEALNNRIRPDSFYVEALGRIGDERAVEPLIEALNISSSGGIRDSDIDLWGSAVVALGYFGYDRIVEPLIEVLENPNQTWTFHSKHEYAVEALGLIGDSRAVWVLIAASNDDNPAIRRKAIEALCKIGDKRSKQTFIDKLNDENQEVRIIAARALRKLDNDD